MSGLVDQSLSISWSVVGTVPILSNELIKLITWLLKHCIAALICDLTGASCHLVSLSHKKGCLLTAQPLIMWIKKRKPINHFKKGH